MERDVCNGRRSETDDRTSGGDYGITELSQAYGVSRKTVYKWIGRYEKEGWLGLEDRSRAPHRHANAVERRLRRSF